MYSDKIKSLGLSMFLGLSCGKWFPEHIPTVEEPYLLLKYTGKVKNGRPMKLLNAAARPPKKYRFTKYFNTLECKLIDQTILLYDLRPDVKAEDLVNDFKLCLENATEMLEYRKQHALKAQRTANDPNKELRKTTKKLIKNLLGSEYSMSVAKTESGGVLVTITNGFRKLEVSGVDERDCLTGVIASISLSK